MKLNLINFHYPALLITKVTMTSMKSPHKHVRLPVAVCRQAPKLFVHCHCILETLAVPVPQKPNMGLTIQTDSAKGSGILDSEAILIDLTRSKAVIRSAWGNQ